MPALPCRESEFEVLRDFLKRRWEGKSNNALFVYGSPGQGKTHTIRSVVAADFCPEKYCSQVTFEYLHCANCTAAFLRSHLISILSRRYGDKTDGKGDLGSVAAQLRRIKDLSWTPAKQFARESGRRLVVLYLDEVDCASQSATREILKQFLPSSSTSHGMQSTVAVVMISNGRGKLLEETSIEELPFSSYSVEQLKQVAQAIHAKGPASVDSFSAASGSNPATSAPSSGSAPVVFSTSAIDFIAKSNAGLGDARKIKELGYSAKRGALKRARVDEEEGASPSGRPTAPALVSGRPTVGALVSSSSTTLSDTTTPITVTTGDVAACTRKHSAIETLQKHLSPELLWLLACCVHSRSKLSTKDAKVFTVREIASVYTQLLRRMSKPPPSNGVVAMQLSSLADYGLISQFLNEECFKLMVNPSEIEHALADASGVAFTIAKEITHGPAAATPKDRPR